MAALPAPAEDDWNHEDEFHEAQLQLLDQLEGTMLERDEAEQRAQQAVWLVQQEPQRAQQEQQRAQQATGGAASAAGGAAGAASRAECAMAGKVQRPAPS